MSAVPATLDISKPLKTEYCIPLWLRDEQVKLSTAKIKGRIGDFVQKPRNDRIAVVCFGPSLNDTWEQIRDFRYIISCSGSHKFLLERGIVPTWHVEVDPRPHKIELLGTPHKDVEYLIASACHPDYFDHLLKHGANVKLWHIFTSEADAYRVLPRGEWAITGGSSVGLRAMTIARFLGFTNQHIFGMDGSEGASGKHAAAHPMQPKGHSIVEYGGKSFRTTISMAECARQTWHELDQMPDVKAKFYGEGLVQAMARDYKPKGPDPTKGVVGINRPELISAEYLEQNRELHRTNPTYGAWGGRFAPQILKLAESLKTTSVLDYGCGRGYLAKALPFPIWEYDPAIPEKAEPPRPADICVCTDVLEHIEPDKLMFVLEDLRRCTKKVGFFAVNTGPATKKLPDGRNTHLIQQDRAWWTKHLEAFFVIGKCWEIEKQMLLFVVGPKEIQFTETPQARATP